jgi:phenylalanyl-tRNA synthetase beta chain
MRAPLNWLREYADPGLDARALAERLAMTGTEVERVTTHGVGDEDGFIVGRVLEAERHPDADRLTVCRVAVGEGDVAQIVCGAPNVAAGQTVAVARPGAVMPDGTRLGKAKLRGVVSEGMILAEDEVAIGTDHAGIMVLSDELVPGTPLAEALPIRTDVLELEITPNRPDCLGIYGIAREVHAATGAELAPPPWAEDPGSEGPVEGFEVRVEVPELCPRFTLRAFEDVTIGPSPEWLKAKLMAAGQRPISNVVDITNYVMLLTGQPLHAFDADRVVDGRLVVRRAGEGEQVETLDGQVRTLDPDVVVIEDGQGPTSIAGIMGGARSEVHEGTTRVLMEAATWNGPNIHRTSAKLGLRSEASGRFEKQLQPEQGMQAQAVATQLMLELTGARLVPGTIDVGGPGPEPPRLQLRDAEIRRILGFEVPREESARIMQAIGAEVYDAHDGLEVRVPALRRDDLTREIDLVEEVARLHGLEHVPATLPSRTGVSGRLTGGQKLRRRVEDALADRGVFEILGWSFTAPDLADRLRLPPDDPRRRAVALENPMSEEQSVLRTMLLGSLLDVARHNDAHGHARLRLFESAAVYGTDDSTFEPDANGAGPVAGPPAASHEAAVPPARSYRPGIEGIGTVPATERHHLGVLLRGPARPATWRDERPSASDFFAAKGVLAAVLEALRVDWSVEPTAEPFLHPGRAARVLAAGRPVGWLGEIHPLVARAWDLDALAGFEIDLDLVSGLADTVPAYHDVTSFPAVREDLAVVVAEDVPSQRVLEVVRAAGAPELAAAEVFDVYRGEQVGEGHVSLALRLTYRAPDRTLTDEEVGGRRAAIVAALNEELGASIRA